MDNGSLKKSKSFCSLEDDTKSNDVTVYKKHNLFGYRTTRNRKISDSSVEICVVIDSESEAEEKTFRLADSGIADKSVCDGEMLHVLEQKIDRLSVMFQEQCRLLSTLKEEIRNSWTAMENAEATQQEILTDLVKKAVAQSGLNNFTNIEADKNSGTNSRAKNLLDAIEVRQGISIDREIRNVLKSFLESDDLKEHMVTATAESVKDMIGNCLSRDVSNLYLPILEHSHRRLMHQVTEAIEEAFIELEEKSASLSKSVYKVTKSLRRSIDRHQVLLEASADPQNNLMTTLKCTVEELLQKEIKQWRQKILNIFTSQQQRTEAIEDLPDPYKAHLEYVPPNSPVLANNDCSLVDQLVMVAEITKQIEDGEVNAAFERALSAGDLSLVMAACRAGQAAFQPRCCLHQPVLLALLQQLSTDMLRATHLKCRYLEDVIINLDPTNVLTRTHLPLVVGEVRKHLTKFRSSYPTHTANRRVALIIMAADNLLK